MEGLNLPPHVLARYDKPSGPLRWAFLFSSLKTSETGDIHWVSELRSELPKNGLTGGARCREGVHLGSLVRRLASQLLLRHGVLVYNASLNTKPMYILNITFTLYPVVFASPRHSYCNITTQ